MYWNRKIANELEGEQYDIPYYTPINLGEVVFNNTFVFPNEALAEQYVTSISHIVW